MITAFLTMAPWKKAIDIIIVLVLIGAAVWIYLALVNRAGEIKQLTDEKAVIAKAAADNAAAFTQSQESLAQTTAALKTANQHAEINAAEAGKLKERIANAPKHGCVGPAERTLADSLRTDALNRRSQVPQPIAP